MGIEAQVIANAKAIQKILDDAKTINNLPPLTGGLALDDKTAFYDESSGDTVWASLSNILEGFNANSVEEFNNVSLFPVTGVSNKIYLDKFNNIAYRWDSDVSQYFSLGNVGDVIENSGAITELIVGDVIWEGGLNFFVWFSSIKIDSVEYNQYQSANVTLDPADATFDRFDSIIVEDDGLGALTIKFEKGTASANPSTPVLNIETQLLMSTVLVEQNATEPTGFTRYIVYEENTEWVGIATDPSIDLDGNVNPITGLKSIILTNVPNGEGLQFTSPSVIIPNIDSNISFKINLEDSWVGAFRRRASIDFYLTNGGVDVAGPFVFSDVNQLGFNGSVTGIDQIISFKLNLLPNFENVSEFDGLRLYYRNLNNKTLRLDDIIIISNGDADSPSYAIPFEVKIQGALVLLEGKQFLSRLEVNDKFRMWVGDRYVVGKIIDETAILPDDLDDDTKIKLVIDNEIF